eukprot:Opistho-2@74463
MQQLYRCFFLMFGVDLKDPATWENGLLYAGCNIDTGFPKRNTGTLGLAQFINSLQYLMAACLPASQFQLEQSEVFWQHARSEDGMAFLLQRHMTFYEPKVGESRLCARSRCHAVAPSCRVAISSNRFA